jgi:hypothetical protein
MGLTGRRPRGALRALLRAPIPRYRAGLGLLFTRRLAGMRGPWHRGRSVLAAASLPAAR